ncbi:MAG: hypothetical protein JW863_10715 [Chitinispirillaceae bacterium]|nr:hypothetical protein [Chitinispirillaceae bacterium]
MPPSARIDLFSYLAPGCLTVIYFLIIAAPPAAGISTDTINAIPISTTDSGSTSSRSATTSINDCNPAAAAPAGNGDTTYAPSAGNKVATDRTLSGPVFSVTGDSLAAPPESLITGITPEQDLLARRYVGQVYAFHWSEAERTLKKLQRIERRNKLLPLSGLLAVSSHTIRVLGGEYTDDDEQKILLDEINEIRRKTLRHVETSGIPDSLVPLALFISGGIKGLIATLKIETTIVQAAIEGFDALGKLERVIELAPESSDPYLGTGIFYCLLARSPGIVKAALNLTGRQVSFEKGLDFLRRSAQRGRYTSETAKLYLVRFLSPYWGHLADEKSSLFHELEHRYPGNPYYTFLRLDEIICFHPNELPTVDTSRIVQCSKTWDRSNYSLRRHAQLVTLQLQFITGDSTILLPGIPVDLREFKFYPLFLNALADRCSAGSSGNSSTSGNFTKSESAALRTLGLSEMSTTRRNYYEWHIRDALKLRHPSSPP